MALQPSFDASPLTGTATSRETSARAWVHAARPCGLPGLVTSAGPQKKSRRPPQGVRPRPGALIMAHVSLHARQRRPVFPGNKLKTALGGLPPRWVAMWPRPSKIPIDDSVPVAMKLPVTLLPAEQACDTPIIHQFRITVFNNGTHTFTKR